MSSRPIPLLLLVAATLVARLGAADAPVAPSIQISAGTPAADRPLAAFTAVGASFGKSSRIGDLGWSEAEFNAFLEGVRLAYRGQPVPNAEGTERLYAEMGKRVAEIEARERQRKFSDPSWREKYMQDACKKFSLQRSDSGLAYAVVAKGKGVRPGPDDTVVISVNVTAADGATELQGLKLEKQKLKVSDMVPGLIEGVQMMTLDSRGMFILPPELSYGDGEWPRGIEKGSPLLFVLVLHDVIPAP